MTNFSTIQASISEVVLRILAEIKNNRNDRDKCYSAIYDGLSCMVEQYSTQEYSFNLAMDIFIEAAHENFSGFLSEILDNTDFEESDSRSMDIAFAAYYALSLILKKEKKIDKLGELLTDKYRALNRYPLRNEVFSRYYKRTNEHRKALDYDQRAIRILKSRNTQNLAVCISYASTVCKMLKDNISPIHDEEIILAKKYAEDAIKFNPEYSKYYFINAQLTFYHAIMNPDIDLKEAANLALDAIEDAYLKAYDTYNYNNIFSQEELSKYDEYKSFIEKTLEKKSSPRFPESISSLDELKEQILSSSNQAVCASGYFLPRVPELRNGDKYFFVCYSSEDFKSVYCDLIELYKQKVPFKYDERLVHGRGWQEQIEQYIGDENCVGVVYYLSKSVVYSTPVCEEMRITKKYGKKHICVNLEDRMLPSQVFAHALVEKYQKDPGNFYIPSDQMSLFLSFFHDNDVFTHKFKENKDDGIKHFKAYIDSLSRAFREIYIGD